MLKFANFREVKEYISRKNTRFITFYVSDIDGRLRNVTLPVSAFSEKTVEEGIGFDASNLGFATVDHSDMILKPDLNFAFEDPVEEDESILYFMCHMMDLTKRDHFDQDLRHIVQKAVGELEREGIADQVKIGLELEFNILDELFSRVTLREVSYRIVSSEFTSPSTGEEIYRIASNRGYFRAEPNDHLFRIRNQIAQALDQLGIAVKYHHHEVGSSQCELEFRFLPIDFMADGTVLAKSICHRIARRNNRIATFLPRIIPGEAGNGMHIHIILEKCRQNVFYHAQGLYQLSPVALQFIAGILDHSSSLLAFTNPTTNSYRRLIPGFEAPVYAVFAEANRSAAIRIPGYIQDPLERRFEFRTLDATCNPYLAYAAIVMAGLDGIRRQLDPTKQGFGPLEKNLYELPPDQLSRIKAFPTTLEAAIDGLLADQDYLTYRQVFPAELITKWIQVKRKDIAEMQRIPHPWEVARYYDL